MAQRQTRTEAPEFASWPQYTAAEIDAVASVLLSNRVNYWTGEQGRSFEREFAAFTRSKYAVALANGTVALDLALKVLGTGAGDEVIVAARTFIASVSCIVNAGGKPVFADVEPDSQNISAKTIRAVLTSRTRGIICVHLAGWPCEMDSILELARQHGLWVIEDCAQAHGARYKGRSVGTLADVAAWSFCQDKIMTTGGEGGMLTTNDKNLWERAWSYKDHGKSWEAVYKRAHPPGFRWVHESFGTNWRLTEMQAALGRSQIKRMPEWHAVRKRNAEAILSVCEKFPTVLRVPRPPRHVEHAWYRCYVFVKRDGIRNDWSRSRIMQEITARGVPCSAGSCSEVYLEKAFEKASLQPEKRLPVAAELGETSLAFLVHPALGENAISYTCTVLEEVLNLSMRRK
jgi:dTDP-4-amino-4,6-dideoxygalactose transaminase